MFWQWKIDKNNNEIRISLNQNDFRTLISGGIVEKDNVKIILQDIWYWTMLNEITNKMN